MLFKEYILTAVIVAGHLTPYKPAISGILKPHFYLNSCKFCMQFRNTVHANRACKLEIQLRTQFKQFMQIVYAI